MMLLKKERLDLLEDFAPKASSTTNQPSIFD